MEHDEFDVILDWLLSIMIVLGAAWLIYWVPRILEKIWFMYFPLS